MKPTEIHAALIDAGFRRTDGSRHAIFEKNGVRVTMPKNNNAFGSAPWHIAAMKTALRRAERGCEKQIPRRAFQAHLFARDVVLNQPVRTLCDFVDVPRGTYGTITGDYGTGFVVTWEFADGTRLDDSFDKQRELQFLKHA